MNRLQALEALAEAAKELRRRGIMDEPLTEATNRLCEALDDLHALPADPAPAQEVEVAVWEEGGTGRVLTVRAGSDIDKHYAEASFQRLGTVRLPLVKGDKS